MINSISWASYGYALTISLIIYYLVVGFIYYKDEIRQIFFGTRSNLHLAGSEYIPTNHTEDDKSLFSIVQSLAGEIDAFLQEVSAQKYEKGELLRSLSLLVSKYPAINSTSYVSYINSVIKKNILVICSITISDDDLKGLWIDR
jgi:hypothetical protein